MERRSSPRLRAFKGGSISFGAAAGIDCIIRNLSETGAAIDLEVHTSLPDSFSAESARDLLRRTEKLKTRGQPLAKKIKKPKATWLKPQLMVDVEYRALTAARKLRHPSFKGIREDI